MNPLPPITSPLRRGLRRSAATLVLGLSWTTDAAVAGPWGHRDVSGPAPEIVVLLHGWWSHPAAMIRIQWSLRAAGYQVVNVAYRSVRVPLEEIATHQLPEVLKKKVPPAARMHFVTHSMGGLLLRQYLEHHRPANLGRIVMLGPPNQGSELVDGHHLALTRWIVGPNHRCLATASAARPKPLPGLEIGIVAGDRQLLPTRRKLPTPNDGRVSVDSTRLDGMTDHRVVHVSHSLMQWNGAVIELVRTFLATGGFGPAPAAKTSEERLLPVL